MHPALSPARAPGYQVSLRAMSESSCHLWVEMWPWVQGPSPALPLGLPSSGLQPPPQLPPSFSASSPVSRGRAGTGT